MHLCTQNTTCKYGSMTWSRSGVSEQEVLDPFGPSNPMRALDSPSLLSQQVSAAPVGATSSAPDPSGVVSSASTPSSTTSSSSSPSSSSSSSPEHTLHRSSPLSKGVCQTGFVNGPASLSAAPASQPTTIGRFQVSASTGTTSGPAAGSKVGRFSVTGVSQPHAPLHRNRRGEPS